MAIENAHRKIVDEYLVDHEPSKIRTEIPFKLRTYVSYVDKNHIQSPDDVPDEIIASFSDGDDEEGIEMRNLEIANCCS